MFSLLISLFLFIDSVKQVAQNECKSSNNVLNGILTGGGMIILMIMIMNIIIMVIIVVMVRMMMMRTILMMTMIMIMMMMIMMIR